MAGFVFDRQKCSTEFGSDTQKRKKIGGNNLSFEVSGALHACQREFVLVIGGHVLENLILRTPIFKIGVVCVA